MFKFATKLFGLALVVAATASVALAQDASTGSTGDVPEINAGSMISALTLLSGGVLMLTDKIRRK